MRGRARAMRRVLWGSVAYVVLAAATSALLNSPTQSLRWLLTRYTLAVVAESACVVLLAAAHWALGRPPPADAARLSPARRLYRGGALLVAGAKPVWLVLNLFGRAGSEAAANWAGAAGVGVGTVGFFGYLRELALRVPDDRLARAAGVLRWGMGLALALYAALGLWVQVAQPRWTSMPPPWFIGAAGASAATLVVGALWGATVLLRLERRFSAAAAGA